MWNSKFVQFCANVVDGRQFEKLWLAPKTANWAVQAHTVWSKRNSHFYGLHAAHLAAFEASALSDLWTMSTGVFIQGRVLGIFVGNAIGAGRPQLVSCPYLDAGAVGEALMVSKCAHRRKFVRWCHERGWWWCQTWSAVTFAPILRLERKRG